MAIDPKLVSIKKVSDIPTVPLSELQTGQMFGYTGDGDLKKVATSDLLGFIKSGIKGTATQSNAPTPYTPEDYPNGLFETYVVRTPLTMPNSWGSAVTQAELDANYVYFDVRNGVVSKNPSKKPTPDLSNVLNPLGTTKAPSEKAVSDYIKSNDSKTLKFEVASANLVNTKDADYLLNTQIGTDGTIYPGTQLGHETSGFISVKESTFYTPNQKSNVIFYNANKNYITAFDNGRATLSFKTPLSTAFVRLVSSYNGGVLRLVEGDFSSFPQNGNVDYKLRIQEVNGVEVVSSAEVPTKTSQLTNDSSFATTMQLNSSISNLVAVTYLQTNYQTKTEAKDYADNKINVLTVGTSQINNQSITQDKLSVSLFNALANGSPVTITNNPDENDLTANGGVLSLKDRSDYIYLKKGVVITQAVVNSWTDKKVEIRHGHTISEDINFTENITLIFNGGFFTSTNARKINGNSCTVIADRYWIFRNIFTYYLDHWDGYSTKFKAEKSYPEWFGSGYDSSVLDCTAIRLANSKFDSVISLKRGKTYEINKSLEGTIEGNFATLKKNPVSVDINVLSAIPSSSPNVLVINVDSLSPDLAKLKVGMQLEFVNKEGSARKVNLVYKIITAISGNSISLYGLSGDSTGFSAGEAQMVNCFKSIQLYGVSNSITNLKIDGSRDSFTHNRTYWEFSQEIFISGLSKYAKVQGCIIQNCQSEGITTGGHNTVVKGCVIQNCGGNGIHLSGSYNVKVEHNQIYDTNKKLSTGHNEGAITYSNENYLNHISNNVFDGCLTGIGSIDAGFNSDSFILNNTFRRYKTHGIDCLSTTGGGNVISNMVISGNRFLGKHILKNLESSYMPVIENNFLESNGYSINLDSNGSYFEGIVISNNIFECGSVFAKNSEITITGNTFTEKNKSFSESFVDSLIVISNSIGSIGSNSIISESTNRDSILNIDAVSKVAFFGNFIKGKKIKKEGTTTDLANNTIITII